MWAWGSMYRIINLQCLRGRLTRPRAAGSFSRGGRDGLFGGIAEFEEHAPRAALSSLELLERALKGGQAEIGRTVDALDAVQERGQIDQLAARVHEIHVENLLLFHKPIRCRSIPPGYLSATSQNS